MTTQPLFTPAMEPGSRGEAHAVLGQLRAMYGDLPTAELHNRALADLESARAFTSATGLPLNGPEDTIGAIEQIQAWREGAQRTEAARIRIKALEAAPHANETAELIAEGLRRGKLNQATASYWASRPIDAIRDFLAVAPRLPGARGSK